MTRHYPTNLKKHLLTVLFSCLVHLAAFAQTTVDGRVVGEDNTPLGGVSVFNQTQDLATSTNDAGEFSINARIGDVLLFTSVGYGAEERTLSSLSRLTVVLLQADQTLDEVVVINYGTVKRTKVTASVSTLDNQVLETGMRANPAQALAGTIPGVRVSTATGRPGSIPSITLRGGTHWDG